MASQAGGPDLLENLYPVPLSTGVAALPGPSEASARALLSVLKHNHQTHHIFFSDRGFHKYVQFSFAEKPLSLLVMPRTTYWPSMPSAHHPKS